MSRRGWCVGREDRDPAPSRNVLLGAGALTRPTGHVRRPARQAEPSWGRVLVNTVKLSVLRQLRAAGLRRASGSRGWPARRRWRLATLVLALAGAAVIVLRLAGGLTSAPSRAARVPVAGAGPPSVAAGPQAQAAAWIAAQVSGSAIVACSPGMCAALQEQGVAAGRLMLLRSAAASPRGAGVLVILCAGTPWRPAGAACRPAGPDPRGTGSPLDPPQQWSPGRRARRPARRTRRVPPLTVRLPSGRGVPVVPVGLDSAVRSPSPPTPRWSDGGQAARWRANPSAAR